MKVTADLLNQRDLERIECRKKGTTHLAFVHNGVNPLEGNRLETTHNEVATGSSQGHCREKESG